MGVWSSGRGGEQCSKCISSLASGAVKREAGPGAAAGAAWAVTQEQRTVRRDKKEGEMIKKLPRPPCLSVYLSAQWNQAEQRLEPLRV